MAPASTKMPAVAPSGQLSQARINHLNGHSTSTEKSPPKSENEDGQPSKRTKLPARTDYNRWRLLDEKGRLTWHYLEDDQEVKTWPQSLADKYFLDLPLVGPSIRKEFNCQKLIGLEGTSRTCSCKSTIGLH
jgi:hypothetical protein